jgi:hypothetical protein
MNGLICRHANSRVAAASHHTNPASFGGARPWFSASTQRRDEPGNRPAKTSGYRATSDRFRMVARTTQTVATLASGPNRPAASASSSAALRVVERTAAPMSPIVFQHSHRITRRRAEHARTTSIDRQGSAGRVGSSNKPVDPVARPSLRTSSCMARWPASTGPSSESRLMRISRRRPRATAMRCRPSTSSLVLASSTRPMTSRLNPARSASCACVHLRRRREARISRPIRERWSRARLEASRASADRRPRLTDR